MNATRKRTVGLHQGKNYSLIQYNHDFTIAKCEPDGREHSHALVEPSKYCPSAPAGVKRAPASIPPSSSSVFVKYPNLTIHHGPAECRELKRRTRREVRFCEGVLRAHPHANVAQYVGCIVVNGLVRGICYARYATSLADLVDPPCPTTGYYTPKEEFRYGPRRLPKGRAHFMATLRAGVEHIHSLGYVHMDLKPENVCVRDGSAVVIDFDSVLRQGERSWGVVPQTPGWCDPLRETAEFESDADALHDIAEWLSDEPVKEFRLPDVERVCAYMGGGVLIGV